MKKHESFFNSYQNADLINHLYLPEDLYSKRFADVKDPRISVVCKLWNAHNSSLMTFALILLAYGQKKSMDYFKSMDFFFISEPAYFKVELKY